MSTKSVCSRQYTVTSALSDRCADKAQYIVRSHQGTATGTQWSSVLGGRRKEKARSERVVVEHSKPVRQPLGMTDHRESNDAWYQ